ncbi:MAG: hypothetical protein ACRDMA_07660 [Solirubrobacterales bacterium]
MGLALPAGEDYMRRVESGERRVAEDVIHDALGEAPGQEAGLGEVAAINGSLGRGAEGWCAVAEWSANAIGTGIVGAAAWAGTVRAGRWLQEKVSELRRDERRVLVSRGGAILLAVNHVLAETSEEGPLGVEVAEDPISMTGDSPSEAGYAGIEPWLISLVSAELTKRYVVAISAAGEPLSLMQMPMSEAERMYSRLGPPYEGD